MATRHVVVRANRLVIVSIMLTLLVVVGFTWDRLHAAREARQWTQHSYAVLLAIADLQLAIREAETGQRGYLLTGDERYLAPYRAAIDRVGALQADLSRLTADDPAVNAAVRALTTTVQHKLEELAQTVRLRHDVGAEPALRIVAEGTGLRLMTDIAAELDRLRTVEGKILEQRRGESDARTALVRLLFGSGVLLALGGLLWAARQLNAAWARSYALEGEQRLTAMRLRGTLDSISQGVGLFGPDGRLIEWNHCFKELLDLPDALLQPTTTYATLATHTASAEAPLLEEAAQIRHTRARAGTPIVYERFAASGRHLELRRTPTDDDGFVLTISDMTERSRAEAVLREAQKMQAIGQLTGGIAHDFNNLLQVILGNLEIVRARTADEALGRRMERAAWAAQRGATLTAQLLAFARKQPLAPAPLDLSAVLPNLVPLLRRTLGETIDIQHVENAGLWSAMADGAQLESTLLNLALNARDAMPEGGRLTIELANRVLDEDYASRHAEVMPGDYVMLAVSDTGHGMTPAVRARVFEPFYTTKPDGRGTGLGLAMVFGFVKQSGGHIKIYSEPGEGTTVKLYLPRAAGVAVAAQRNEAPADLPRGSATVLVLEDEDAVREIATDILRELGYRVLEAGEGEAALRLLEDEAGIGLLLTDVVLPGTLKGRDVAERARRLRPALKVLFMSGYTENAIVHHGRLDEGVQLIGKPFKREQLARRVAEVLAEAPAPGS